MKIEKKKAEGDVMTFTLSGAPVAIANSLRRTLLSEIPTMAITEVDVYENSSSLFDEFIAHRLGLIPLTTDLKSYTKPEECCNGQCGKCSTMLTLEAEGPGVVYSGQLKSKDSNIKPTEKKIPIITLAEGQRIRIEAKATLGTAKQHARHQACFATYKMQPSVEVTKEGEKEKDLIKACPVKIFVKKGDKVTTQNEETCTECRECVKLFPKAVKIGHDENTFLFTIESYGNLDVKDILKTGLEIMQEKASEFQKQLK